MNLLDTAQLLGNFGEFVGAIGVVVTLVYLSVQIRQSTIASRAQSRQTLLDQWSSSNWDLSKDPNSLRIYANAITNWPDLRDDEKTMFEFGMARYLANIQNGLFLRDSGMVDDRTVEMVADYLMLCLRSPGGARWWQDTAMALPETRLYIERQLARDENPAATAEKLFPHWIAMLGNQQ